ncbi:hypothetical protein EVAR_76409_1 [Eumeta japonica]|uniref:Uncharacterized protein n=1 Tax=Eumeta variegata TaxID=151549 RepID=A0A4C1T8V5_EUMVA|nr:hypothetical protein EVAR_76409_1 [Eumeta japonica]
MQAALIRARDPPAAAPSPAGVSRAPAAVRITRFHAIYLGVGRRVVRRRFRGLHGARLTLPARALPSVYAPDSSQFTVMRGPFIWFTRLEVVNQSTNHLQKCDDALPTSVWSLKPPVPDRCRRREPAPARAGLVNRSRYRLPDPE